MQNVLEAKITADISDLKSKLSQAEKLQQDYAKSIEQTQKELAENISISKGYEKAIEELNKELKDGVITQKEFQKQLQRLKRDEKETEVETARLRKELSKLKREQKDLASVNGKTGSSFGNVKKNVTNTTPTLLEFNRVIQDAPFGIQGVANNITQLTQNFGQLQKSAGGTLPALKALASGFAGPAGILFAVSAVTSILVSYGDEILGAISGTNKLAKASAEYVGEAQSEIIALNQLVEIASDETKSKKVRQGAIDEINSKYSKYLGNLDLESIKTDKVRASIDALSKSLIQQAKIKGIADIISEQTKDDAEEILRLELEREDAIKRQAELQELLSKASTGREEFQLTRQLDQVEKKIQDVNNELLDINKSAEESLKPFLDLQEKLQSDVFEGGFNEASIKENEKANKEKTKATESYAERQKKLFDQLAKEEISQNEKTIDEFIKQWENVEINVDPFDGEFIKIEEGFQEIVRLEDKIKELQTLLKSLGGEGVDVDAINLEGLNLEQLNNFENRLRSSAETSKIITDAMSSSFGALSQNIASSLQTGNEVLDSFVGSLINSLGKMLSELASAAIQQIAINQATATSSAIAGGAASGAATGPGAIFSTPGFIAALVGVVGAAFAGIATGFASGGIVPGGNFSGDRVPAFLNSGEVVLNGRQQAQTLMAVANGNMARASADNEGGIVGEVILRGENQVIQLRRAERNMRRYFNN